MPESRTLLLHAVSTELDAREQPHKYISDAQLKYLAGLILGMNQLGRVIKISFDDGHKSILRAVEVIRGVSEDINIKVFIPTFIFEKPTKGHLDIVGLRSLSQHKNLTIGSHGHYHRALTRLSRAELSNELTKSRDILEGILAKRVSSISYPYGEVNSCVRGLSSFIGFSEGYTSFWGINKVNTDPFLLHRIEILGSDSPRKMSVKLTQLIHWRGALQKIRYLRRLV